MSTLATGPAATSPWAITVVGVGHVGRPLLWALLDAALVAEAVDRLDLAIVDFDVVGDRDVRKGYQARHRGRFKVDALADEVASRLGAGVAARVRPVVAAAQSVPGLLRDRVVFSAPDNNRSRAWIGQRAASTLLLDLATGTGPGGTGLHRVGFFPPGTATPGDTFSAQTWGDANFHRCDTGAHVNAWAGARFPYGGVVANLAIAAWLGRQAEERPFAISMNGARVERSEWHGVPGGSPERHVLVGRSAGSTLGDVAEDVRRITGASPEELVLRFEVPLVHRSCTAGGPGYAGFERYPVTGLCPHCRGPWRLDWSQAEARPLVGLDPLLGLTLRQLCAPSGLGFQRAGDEAAIFALPFSWEDVPELPPLADGPGTSTQTQARQETT